MEGVPYRYHEDHIAAKGINSFSHYNLVARVMGSKACQKEAAAGPRGSRTCVCANTYGGGWHMQGRKGELTSCRGTVKWAWQKTPVRGKEGRTGLPARVSGRHVVRR